MASLVMLRRSVHRSRAERGLVLAFVLLLLLAQWALLQHLTTHEQALDHTPCNLCVLAAHMAHAPPASAFVLRIVAPCLETTEATVCTPRLGSRFVFAARAPPRLRS